jgi:hypothetical protein
MFISEDRRTPTLKFGPAICLIGQNHLAVHHDWTIEEFNPLGAVSRVRATAHIPLTNESSK